MDRILSSIIYYGAISGIVEEDQTPNQEMTSHQPLQQHHRRTSSSHWSNEQSLVDYYSSSPIRELDLTGPGKFLIS